MPPNTFVAFHGEGPAATPGLADPVLPDPGLGDAVLPDPELGDPVFPGRGFAAPLDTNAVPTMNTMTPISRRVPPVASSQRAARRRLCGEDRWTFLPSHSGIMTLTTRDVSVLFSSRFSKDFRPSSACRTWSNTRSSYS